MRKVCFQNKPKFITEDHFPKHANITIHSLKLNEIIYKRQLKLNEIIYRRFWKKCFHASCLNWIIDVLASNIILIIITIMTISIMTLSIVILSIKTLSITTLIIMTFSITTFSLTTLIMTFRMMRIKYSINVSIVILSVANKPICWVSLWRVSLCL